MAAGSLSRAALGAPRALGAPGAPGAAGPGPAPAAAAPRLPAAPRPGTGAERRGCAAAPQGLPRAGAPRLRRNIGTRWSPTAKRPRACPSPPRYSPRYVEAAWYQWWERGGVFSPPPPEQAPGGAPVLSLVLPPPNVTGSLHLGHALTVTLQDALVRWRRMQGWSVLWVPGTDHAGIATPGAIVERWLWHSAALRRQDLGRAEFLREVWRWKERHGDEILQQLRALGASLDWSRCAFTMDPGFSRAVTEAFVRLFRAGLIRRDQRVVTWSCALRSALADIEVEPRVLTGPTELNVPNCPHPVTFGVLVTFAYPVEGDDGLEVPVATTRPETLFGDVAVAVHPRDPRYQHLQGRRVRHPFSGALLPVVGDPSVQPELGTGAVKVTPGHSPRGPDLALARAHALPLLSVIADDGTLVPRAGGWLQGVPRFEARARVVAALAQRGLLRGVQDHAMTLPLCSRSGDVVEFLLKRQWFLSCGDMARGALQAVASGRLRLVPKFHEKNWKTWMENVGDWCLSRQLWWGHQVPAYQVRGGPAPACPQGGPQGGPQEEGAVVRGAQRGRGAGGRPRGALGCPPEELHLQQDPDVLDTWFSSALFPFAALGWPSSPDLARFYPNSVLVTGSDLLFFWVARMAMLGQQLTGQLPFAQVLLHSLVRDPQGRKMSKSLGNVIDPRDVIGGATLQELQEKLRPGPLDPQELRAAQEGQRRQFPQGIPECGADALRDPKIPPGSHLALSTHNAHGPEIRVGVASVLTQRRFCNKIWNAVGFVLRALQGERGPPEAPRGGGPAGPPGPLAAGPALSPPPQSQIVPISWFFPPIQVSRWPPWTAGCWPAWPRPWPSVAAGWRRWRCRAPWPPCRASGCAASATSTWRWPRGPCGAHFRIYFPVLGFLPHSVVPVPFWGSCPHLGFLSPFRGSCPHFWGSCPHFGIPVPIPVEVAKGSLRCPQLRAGALATLVAAAELGLRLLAPFAPFVAEELWQRLPRAPPAPPHPSAGPPSPTRRELARWRCPELEAQVAAMLELVRAVRGLREALRLGGAARPPVLVQGPELAHDWLEQLGPAFRMLSGAGPVQLLPPGVEPGPGWAGAPAASGTFVHLRLQADEVPAEPGDPRGPPGTPSSGGAGVFK
ncbi:LOW QUALITY PROTEIN: valine--tRNA ligase, mitochondrial-like [Passer domesticus]|uniref:LOW QUALITY PROTEIN: valine--tRNA ligase, mitochondrial-like n=1 Tax=Passer domesticus TaxID=48849 RepID=UPI0030FE600D